MRELSMAFSPKTPLTSFGKTGILKYGVFMNTTERIEILDEAIMQREKVLHEVKKACSEASEMSDFGWFLTLGSEPLGMLTAVSAGKDYKELNNLARQLENEILVLLQSRNAIN